MYTGPAVNLLFSSRVTKSQEENSDPFSGHEGERVQNISRADYAIVVGMGINSFFLKTGNFFADIRISQDVSPFATPGGDKLYNHYYSLAAGYTFR
jgi:hypothetical protein